MELVEAVGRSTILRLVVLLVVLDRMVLLSLLNLVARQGVVAAVVFQKPR
jgi:hypothetical protein